MHKLNCTLAIFGLILMLALLAACAPTITQTPNQIPATPTLTPISIPTLTLTPTSTPWQAPDEWWTKPQIQAFSQPLFGSYLLPDNETRPDDYFLDFYSKAGVTFLNWNDIRWIENSQEAYPGIIEGLHKQQKIVVGTISMVITLFDTLSTQELEPAVMVDPYGNKLGGHQLWEGNYYLMSDLHPAFQDYLLSIVKSYIDAGVDGILIDELAYGSARYPDFNENTMIEFRQYLLDTYSPDELAVYGQQYGVADFNTLDYAALVRLSLPVQRTSISQEDWQWELYSKTPFFIDYQRFVRIKYHEFTTRLISEAKTYAMQKYGREIPFSANLNTLTAPEALYQLDVLDYVDLEYFYQPQGYFPRGRALTAVHIAQSLEKHPFLVTSFLGTDPDIAARGIEKSTNLFKTMIAEGYANGAPLTVMEGVHEIKQDITALASYYRFPNDYPWLFEDMTPVKGQVGLLYLFEGRDVYNYTDMRGLGQMLADSGYQFSILFGAEESTWWGSKSIYPAPDHPLTLAALTPFPLVIVPQLDDITPNHADILLQYVTQGGKLVVFTTQNDLNNLTPHRGRTPGAVQDLLGYIRAGKAELGQGRIITIAELWGKPYTVNPRPTMRQPLLDLLAAENVFPEVKMSSTNFVGAFMNQGSDSLTVHFVNYDYNPETDSTTPADPVQVEITLPEELKTDNPTIYLYSPDAPMQELNGEITGDQLLLTLPEFNVWDVLWIGTIDDLQLQVNSYPTSTPLPTATPTPSYKPGMIIYHDGLSEGWQPFPDGNAATNMESTVMVYQGSNSIEMITQSWGTLALDYNQTIDSSRYAWMVINVNPADTANLNFYIRFYDQENEVKSVLAADYLEGNPLQPNQWRRILIPLSDLNPEGVPFNRILIQNESINPATFYLDEIFFSTGA
ncbi:MAG: hypothetical protein AB9897_03270 [Anaerolineaceae bacterium]